MQHRNGRGPLIGTLPIPEAPMFNATHAATMPTMWGDGPAASLDLAPQALLVRAQVCAAMMYSMKPANPLFDSPPNKFISFQNATWHKGQLLFCELENHL